MAQCVSGCSVQSVSGSVGDWLIVWYEDVNQGFTRLVFHWVSGSVGEWLIVWFEDVNQ